MIRNLFLVISYISYLNNFLITFTITKDSSNIQQYREKNLAKLLITKTFEYQIIRAINIQVWKALLYFDPIAFQTIPSVFFFHLSCETYLLKFRRFRLKCCPIYSIHVVLLIPIPILSPSCYTKTIFKINHEHLSLYNCNTGDRRAKVVAAKPRLIDSRNSMVVGTIDRILYLCNSSRAAGKRDGGDTENTKIQGIKRNRKGTGIGKSAAKSEESEAIPRVSRVSRFSPQRERIQ